MNITETGIKDLLIIEPKIFDDPRGYFFESYNQNKFKEFQLNFDFIQDNQSKSSYGVVRGLHYQLEPYAQTKLIRVLQGKILDVAVDIRKGSPTYGKHFPIELSEDNKKQLLVPKGFAHGFSVLSEKAVVLYKCDNIYKPEAERGILYNDPDLIIDWKINDAIISKKDQYNPLLKDAENNFEM